MRPAVRVSLLLLLCLGASRALAQSGGLRIQVLQANDLSPLPGATVSLSNTQRLIAPTSELTDVQGYADFPVLRSGSGYVIEVQLPGFAGQRLADQRVNSHTTRQIRILLTTTVEETVEVVAHSDVVELDETGGSSKFDEDFIENLPVPGRFYQNLLTLAPGVLDPDADGNPNVHGARERDFQAMVGGVSNVDPLTGEWLSRINSESIEEMEVIPWGAGAEFGRAAGGFARILQKQGSNEFEGVFSLLYGSSALDGPGADDLPEPLQPDFEWFQPAIQFSGPIVRDKLWFRLSHERIKREDPVDLIGQVVTVERDQRMNADQLTWQVSPRNKLAFQFQSDPLTVNNLNVSSRVAPASAQTLERGGQTYSLTWTAPYSSKLLIDTQIAYQDHERSLSPQSESVEYNGCAVFGVFGFSEISSLNNAHCLNTDTGRINGPYPETSRDRRQRFTARSQATIFLGRWLGATHQLKLGFIAENERYFRELERRPDMTFFSEPLPPGGPFDAIGYSVVRVTAPLSSEAKATGISWALFAQDEIKPVHNLVLSLGLRYDREEIDSPGRLPFDPAAEAAQYLRYLEEGKRPEIAASLAFTSFGQMLEFRDNVGQALETNPLEIPLGPTAVSSGFWPKSRRIGNIEIDNNNLSPRLAVAWDPWSNGKTRFSLSAGRYYDKIVLAVPLLELEPPETLLTFVSFPYFEEHIFFDYGLRGGFNPAVRVQAVDRDLKTPYQDEFALSVEREVARETSIRGTYLRRHFEDQLQDIDVNHAVADLGRCAISATLSDPVVIPSPGAGTTLTDPYTGAEYVDRNPGAGDGFIDDCTGDVINIGGTFLGRDVELPDGLPDLYQLNPGWGEVLLVGNFNTTEYEAFVVELVRRMYRGWQMNASYTWSEAVGDAEDFGQILGNETTLKDDERGFLSHDQRHVFNLSAIGLAGGGVRLGGTLRWESGLPFSNLWSKLTVFGRSPALGSLADTDQRFRFRYPTRQRNDQRNRPFWTIDAKLAKDFSLGRRVQMQFSLEIFNLLDDHTLVLEDRINGLNAGTRRFGRRWQIGTRIAF